MNAKPSAPLFWIGAATILVIAAALRFSDLAADPSAAVDGDFISDEGWWARNARNHALFGRWVTDDFNQGAFAAPFHSAMVRAGYWAFGVGLWQARFVSSVSGLLTLLIIVAWLRWTLGGRAALFGGAAFAADYFSYTYHRIAMVEANAVLMMTLAVGLCSVPRWRRLALTAAGVVGVTAVFTKMNCIYVWPALLVAALVRPEERPESRKHRLEPLVYVALGASICASIWGLWFVIPNLDDFLRQNRGLAVESQVVGKRLLTQAFSIGLVGGDGPDALEPGGFLSQASIPIGLGMTWLVMTAVRLRREGWRRALARTSGPERVAVVWIAMQFAYLASHIHTNDRRYLSFAVPLTVLGAALTTRHWHDLGTKRDALPSSFWARWGAALPLLAAAAIYARGPIASVFAFTAANWRVGAERGLTVASLGALATLVTALVLLPITAFVLPRAARRSWPVAATTGAFALLAFGLVLPSYARDFSSRTHTMRDAGEAIQRRWGPHARVFGGLGDTLLMSSRYPTLFVLHREFSGFGVYGRDFVESFDPTHVFEVRARNAGELERIVEPLAPGYAVVPDTVVVYELCRQRDGTPRFHAAAASLRRRDVSHEPERSHR